MRLAKLAKEIGHFSGDMFGVAKSASVFGNPYRSKLTRPDIYILEEMVVDRPIVTNAKSSSREWFVRPLGCAYSLKGIERSLLTKIGNVLEDRCTGVTVGV